MQQHARLRHVHRVGGRRRQAVRQTRFGVHPDMRLHPEVPLVSLLRLVHLRIPFSPAVLRRRRRVNDARIHDRPRLQPMPERRQMHIDLLEQPHPQALRLQQVAEVQDRRLVRQRTAQAQTRKAAHRLHLVEQILHARIAQVVEQLHTMNPQHHPKRIGAAATASLRIERLDPILQLLPGNQPLHLLQEDLPARPPLLRIVLQFRKSHLKLHGPLTAPRSFHATKLHPSCSELP